MKAIITFLCILSSAFVGGGGFTVDGLNYEIESFNPNEVSLIGGTNTSSFIIPRDVTDQGVTYRVVKIGFRAFEDDLSLTSVTLPESIREIRAEAFFNTGLTEVIALTTTPPSVEADSFGDRSTIDLTVPSGTEEAYVNNGWTGFASINGISSITFEVDAITYGINSFSENTVDVISTSLIGSLNIPETVTFNGTVYTVTAIVGGAFENNQLTAVTLPNTIITIGPEAFLGNQLTNLVLPNSITTIGERAFLNNQLMSVVLPNAITTLGRGAFESNQIESIDIPGSLTVLENSVFRFNELSSIHLAEGITTINPFAFENNDLTSITIPSSVTSISTFAFRSSPLTEMEVLATIPPVIGTPFNTFENPVSIDLTVPEGTEAAYEAAGWTGFGSVNGVVILNVGVPFTEGDFSYRVTSLTPNEVEITGGTTVPQNLLIPDSVTSQDIDFVITSVGINAFENMGITSVQLPNTIRNIRVDAFRLNQLTTIDLPNSVITIGNRAFEVNDISTLVIPPNVTAIGNTGNNDSFDGRANINLFIPIATAQEYIDGGWTGFNAITEGNPNIVIVPKVFLQGASLNPITGEEGLMRDDLRLNGLLPTTSPFGDGATVDPAVFTTTGANAIVDWVVVELRQGVDNENTTVIESTPALLQRNGDIVALNGITTITFTEDEGDYFVAIGHRNHIGIMAAISTALSDAVSTLDFTQDAAFAKGENLALTTLVNGTVAMIAGDVDGSSQILNTDINEGLSQAGGGEAYTTADADMNGFVLNTDVQLLILVNSGTVQQFD